MEAPAGHLVRVTQAADDWALGHLVLTVLQHVAGPQGQAGTQEKSFFVTEAMIA